MSVLLRVCVAAAMTTALVGCVTVAPVPGAERIQLTKNAADVASCKAVGNVESAGSPLDVEPSFRNQAVGLGADTVFVTDSWNGREGQGVAYKCK
jgi:hypothetical protein